MKLMHIISATAMMMALVACSQPKFPKPDRKAGEVEALAIINRFTGGQLDVDVQISLAKDTGGRDRYSYCVEGDKLMVKASSTVAACRGFYDYVKAKEAGISSWSGNRFVLPDDLSSAPKSVTSPYRDHQYFNVVTYGYTAPFWDEARWDKEIDWMALHGIDMPLVLIGQEQVYREVFRDMGLTDEEIDAWEVGPAHLPWMRMGNLAGNSFDGPLGKGWNKRQVEICHHVIDRMRRMGMKPICPAFGGFVPKAFVDHYDGTIDYTGWDWVPKDTRNFRLDPRSKAFAEIGTRFIKKWEEKYGKCEYYLSDSFNEMDIPQSKSEMTAYGDAIYKSIRDANPDAVWTMQGWTVGFQRSEWGNGIFKALVKNVPDDKFLLLDMATDYNRTWWKCSYNWDHYDGFYGKQWVWSVIPNMGGKTAFTGVMDYYANGRLDAQNSPNRGNLTGYGIAAEGVENNEIIYELITDGGWVGATDSIDVDAWMANYAACRYGECTPQDRDYHAALRRTVYSDFCDHPQFAWQARTNITGRGNVDLSDDFYAAVERLFADTATLKRRVGRSTASSAIARTATGNGSDTRPKAAASPQEGIATASLPDNGGRLLQADLIEAAAMYVSGKIEVVNSNIRRAVEGGKKTLAREILTDLEDLMLRLDRSLTAHPLYNIETWEAQAMKVATNEADRKRNAVNARRIVSVWYGDHEKNEPVNDYACRIWAGLIRDYYLPRLVGTWKRSINGTGFEKIAFENNFVASAPALSPQPALPDDEVVDFLARLVNDANVLAGVDVKDGRDRKLGDWRKSFFGK